MLATPGCNILLRPEEDAFIDGLVSKSKACVRSTLCNYARGRRLGHECRFHTHAAMWLLQQELFAIPTDKDDGFD